MKEKSNLWLPILLMGAFALSRWPGMLADGLPNFSAAYALAFCCGVYLPRRLAWWLPMATLAASDLLINCYYQFFRGIDSFHFSQLANYAVYGLIVWLGTRFKPSASFASLLGGGLLGAILFYLLTNTASWFLNPFHILPRSPPPAQKKTENAADAVVPFWPPT